MELAIETHGLRRTFGNFVAVDSIDLAVPVGSFYGFLGPNGAGKSTTMKCLTGLLGPSRGEIRILGIDPTRDAVAVKRLIGVVPEDLALFDRLSGLETLAFVGEVHGLDRDTVRRRIRDLLGVMDLESAAGKLVADYSHGMRKKLSLSAALLPGPRLLFLDEPFEGVDAVASRQIKDILRNFIARGGTIFLTSHVLEIVERMADHVGVLDHGRMIAAGPIGELRRGVGDAGGTLEELFLSLVGAGESTVRALSWLGA